MIIASDPHMYKNEYLKKLSKIITPIELSESADIQYSIIDSSGDIDSIAKFIASGNEVDYSTALSGLKSAEIIGIAKSDNTIIAVRVLKNPNRSYKNKVFILADVDPHGYEYELGYNMVDQSYRNMGVSTKLGQMVLSKANAKVFATTRSANTFANKGLITLGFKQVGEPYQSARGNYTLQLWTK
jgi:predicted GNAT family N-acyltransferase